MAEGGIVFQAEPKQPDDIAHIPGVDFKPRMTVEGETLASAEVTITERLTGEDVTSEMLVPESLMMVNDVVAFQVKGGEDETDYLARIRGSTNKERHEHATVILPVRQRPK